ncbi:MAG: hypothetical protein HZA08_04895 [Nitrospirae bacterium]|nr:hypothetical protein [Nitrospirota bacterium]
MTTTRQNILSNIVSTVQGVTSIKHVEANRFTAVDAEVMPYPACFIYSDREERVEEVLSRETWRWTVILEVWMHGNTDAETMLAAIHKAMQDDYTRGGYAYNSYRTGVEFLVIDPSKETHAMLITYTIRYYHATGVM